jgi:hypothetical protein
MNERTAKEIARELCGEPKQIADGYWAVIIQRDDGRVVLFSNTSACEYASQEAFREGRSDKITPLMPGHIRWR